MLILHKNIHCDPSSEGLDGSDEGSQRMVLMKSKKNYPFVIIKYPLLSRALVINIYICDNGLEGDPDQHAYSNKNFTETCASPVVCCHKEVPALIT